MHSKFVIISFCILAIGVFLYSCESDITVPEITEPTQIAGTTFMPPSPQRTGDPQKGKEILLNGSYINSGIPIEIYKSVFGDETENVLNRAGENATIAPEYTAFTHSNGTKAVTVNCLQCHGSYLNGEYIIGLGNINQDFTVSQNAIAKAIDVIIKNKHGEASSEWEAYEAFSKANHAIGDLVITKTVGANPADRLFGILAAHRDKNTLEWNDERSFTILDDFTDFTDVPPWWVLKKKNTPLYTGTGGGDWAKLFMAASTLTLKDADEADAIDEDFVHVLSYLKTIEAPKYPHTINSDLVLKGESIFNTTCAGCHGTYGENESYPNLLVDISVVGTDPVQSNAVSNESSRNIFIQWFNSSWFAKDDPAGELLITNGYIAQPLDGIWASAPYLHNGSVPTLYELLKSSERSTFWRRTAESAYDNDKIGWTYTKETGHTDKFTYDTTSKGYGNEGHTFGDGLSEDDRMALIEYLKTL